LDLDAYNAEQFAREYLRVMLLLLLTYRGPQCPKEPISRQS